MTIFDAAERYREESVPLIVIAGREYGSGSSRDWAAKGPLLQGVRAVIAVSYERIHRKDGSIKEVPVLLRIDTPIEVDYYRHGGILPYVLRQLVA